MRVKHHNPHIVFTLVHHRYDAKFRPSGDEMSRSNFNSRPQKHDVRMIFMKLLVMVLKISSNRII